MLWATVDTIIEMDVLGTPDSVKIIRLNATNLSNVPVTHALNNKEIWLSKTNGFIKCYHFCHFPTVTTEINLVGMDLTGIHPLLNDDIPKLYEGDELIYRKHRTHTDEWGTENTISYAFQRVEDVSINGN